MVYECFGNTQVRRRSKFSRVIVQHGLICIGCLITKNVIGQFRSSSRLNKLGNKNSLERVRSLTQIVQVTRVKRAAAASSHLETLIERQSDIFYFIHRRIQIITSSARKAPACLKASKIATKSAGVAPTPFIVSTMLESSTPGSNTKVCVSGG